MKRSTSTYLDLLRFLAAAIVFLGHLSWTKLSGGFLWQLQKYGHGAVMVFFVLSGFVIAYTTDVKDKSLRDYSLNRLSRLYSVLLPAIVLSFLLDKIGSTINSYSYFMNHENMPFIRMLSAIFFTSESWFLHIHLFNDSAYWSLPYEFWYYVMFGCIIYFTGTTRIVLLAIAALIAGPKILLLAPIWAIGAATYYLSRRVAFGSIVSWPFFLVSLGIVVVLAGQPSFSANHAIWPVGFAVTDYALGIAIAANLLSATQLDFRFGRAGRLIRWAAGFTFSLYLYHLPLLHFAAAVAPTGLPIVLRWAGMVVFVIFAVLLLGSQTEQKKYLLKRWMEAAFVLPARRPPAETLLP